jgi:hypothetical protein
MYILIPLKKIKGGGVCEKTSTCPKAFPTPSEQGQVLKVKCCLGGYIEARLKIFLNQICYQLPHRQFYFLSSLLPDL